MLKNLDLPLSRRAWLLLLATLTMGFGGTTSVILPRSAWNARPPRATVPRPLSHFRGVRVHHSGGSAGASVRSIQDWDMDVRGFVDIGYSYIIRDGLVFEGRGTNHPAHDTFNDTFGVCIIGTYTNNLPSQANLDALVACIRALRAMTGRQLPIDGHRDVASTACPGNALYAHLPTIRARADQEASPLSWSFRNNSFIRNSDGSEVSDSSTGHQLARAHQYPHRLAVALLGGSTRYDELDAISRPGTEDNPRPTDPGDPGRVTASWRYTLQRIWRFSFWGHQRTVAIEAKVDALTAKVDALADALAQLAPEAAQVSEITAADISQTLKAAAYDDDDGRHNIDDGRES